MNECIPICDTDCFSGQCKHIYCHDSTATSTLKQHYNCPHFYCHQKSFPHCCGNDYVKNPYNPPECIPRCSERQCVNGTCIDGLCSCLKGYRLNPTNGRVCIKEPTINVKPSDATSVIKVMNNNSNLNDDISTNEM